MKRAFLFFFIILDLSLNSQTSMNIDSLILKISNVNLESIILYQHVLDHDSNGFLLPEKDLLGTKDTLCNQLFLIGKECSEKLFNSFHDPEKDYTINLILYMIYSRDAFDMIPYKTKKDICAWRLYQKDKDFLRWRKIINGF